MGHRGDFNLDYLGKGSCTNEKVALTDFQYRNKLKQLISSPTRSAKNSVAVIDLIFTLSSELVSQAGVLPYNLSDHDMIYVNFKKTVRTNNKPDMRNYKLAQLHHILTNTDWTQFYESRNTTLYWEFLYNRYLTILDMVAHFKTIKGSSSKEEWVNSECLKRIRNRDVLRAKLAYDSNNDTLRNEFNKARNIARQTLNGSRYTYVRDGLSSNIHNPKKLWSNLKTLMPGKK